MSGLDTTHEWFRHHTFAFYIPNNINTKEGSPLIRPFEKHKKLDSLKERPTGPAYSRQSRMQNPSARNKWTMQSPLLSYPNFCVIPIA
jgi:hypothetical protein